MALTVTEVKNAKARERDYKLADSQGLHLFVTTKGAKSWRFKYRYGEKEKRLTFGLFPEVSLSEARDRRDSARAILRDGKDPAAEAERQKQAAIRAAGATFKAVAEEWMQDKEPNWSPANAARVRFRIERDLYPALGKLPIADITGPMVLRELRKIEKRGSIETAKRVKGYVEGIFRRAKGEHFIDAGAVASVTEIGAALKPTPIGSKQPSLATVPALLELQQAVDRSTSDTATKLASRLLALTVVRVGVPRHGPHGTGEPIGAGRRDRDAEIGFAASVARVVHIAALDRQNLFDDTVDACHHSPPCCASRSAATTAAARCLISPCASTIAERRITSASLFACCF